MLKRGSFFTVLCLLCSVVNAEYWIQTLYSGGYCNGTVISVVSTPLRICAWYLPFASSGSIYAIIVPSDDYSQTTTTLYAYSNCTTIITVFNTTVVPCSSSDNGLTSLGTTSSFVLSTPTIPSAYSLSVYNTSTCSPDYPSVNGVYNPAYCIPQIGNFVSKMYACNSTRYSIRTYSTPNCTGRFSTSYGTIGCSNFLSVICNSGTSTTTIGALTTTTAINSGLSTASTSPTLTTTTSINGGLATASTRPTLTTTTSINGGLATVSTSPTLTTTTSINSGLSTASTSPTLTTTITTSSDLSTASTSPTLTTTISTNSGLSTSRVLTSSSSTAGTIAIATGSASSVAISSVMFLVAVVALF